MLTPPTFITITSPQDGSYINNTVTIEAELIQIPQARSVKFYIDNQLVGEDTTFPYQYTWDTTAYSDGQHQIYASIFQAPEQVPDQANPPLLDSPVVNVIVDNSPPTTPQVTDDGQYTNSLNTLHATWTQSTDPQSGILGYQYSIGTSLGSTDLINWISIGTATEITLTNLNLIHGKTYYFNVRAINGAGLFSDTGSSDGITVNAHIPQITRVIPSNNSTLYVGKLVTIEVSAQDLDFDPLEYQFLVDGQVKQAWSSLNTFNWTVEPSSSDTHLITIQVRDDKGGFVSEDVTYNIQTVPIDATPPSAPIIITGETSNSLESIAASWISEDPETGIIEYQYAIGTTPGSTDVVYWTTYGTNTDAFISGLELTKGQLYYLSVVAKNGAGLKSQATTSSAIKAAKEPRLKITWPQNNALVIEETIKGIAEGIDQVTINGKTVNVNPDETFQGPALIPRGRATKWGVPENDPDFIIMNYPGPTTITATAGDQTQTITVYCYEVFVKKNYLRQWGSYKLGFDSLEQHQSWNTDLLTQPPFPGWAEPFYSSRYRLEGYMYYNGGLRYYYFPWTYFDEHLFWYPTRFGDHYFQAIATSYAGTYPSKSTVATQMTIHTLPAISDKVQPMTLVFKNCAFAAAILKYYNINFDLSQYKVNSQPLKMLYGKWDEYPNACYIVLTDYQPDSDLELYVTMPTYEYTTEFFETTFRTFGFEYVDVLKLEAVREVPYASGTYMAVNTIPIFQPDDGKGRGPCLGLVNMPYLTVMFGEDLSGTVINTAKVSLKIADVKKTYSLIETSADSGVFTEPTDSFSLRLDNPSIQLNSNIQDEITCFATSTNDNIIEQLFNLRESASDSLYFNDIKTFVTITFNNELLPYQNDSLTIYYTNGLLASEETLTETASDSLVFTNEDNTFTITLNNYPGTMPDNIDITIQNQGYLELSKPRLVLHRINLDTYAYTNQPKGGSSDLPPNNPLDDGHGIFRLRINAGYIPSEALGDLNVTVSGGISTETLPLTRQQDGSYMTERLILLPEGIFATYDNVISLNAVDSINTWSVQLKEDIALKERLKAKSALIASTLDEIKDYRYSYNITDIYHIFNDSLDYIAGLDYNLTKQELAEDLPNRSVIYISGHGVVFGEDRIFGAFAIWEDDSLQRWIYLKPSDIQAQGYKLVFLNGCRTADERTNIPEQFKAAFDSEVYIGWKTTADEPYTSDYAEAFFMGLDGLDEFRNIKTVDYSYRKLREEKFGTLSGENARYLGNGSLSLDLK